MTDTQQTQQNMFEIWTQSSNIFASSLSATYSTKKVPEGLFFNQLSYR